MSSELQFIENFSSINEDEFKRILNKNDSPFIKYPFLRALEESNSVCEISGWKPSHLIELENKKLELSEKSQLIDQATNKIEELLGSIDIDA